MSLSLSVLLPLLLCFGSPLSASPFSFVTVQDGHSHPGKQHRCQHRHRHRHRHRNLQEQSMPAIGRSPMPTPTPTAMFSFVRNEQNSDCQSDSSDGQAAMQSRRRMVSSIVAGVISSGVVNRHLKHAFAANANAAMMANAQDAIGTSDRPVAIVGGSGRTGMAVAESVADPGFGNMHAITLTRSGKDPFQIVKLPQATKDHLRHRDEPFDVRQSQETISASLKALTPSVVVYAASASRQGGNAFEVDDAGVEKVALACKEIGATFVLISALAVDRPESKSYQITNTLGGNLQGIMDAKYNGESKTRKIFSSAKSDYVIVRPGVLLNGKTTTGPMGLELNQGDTIGGGISRDELAGVVVGAIQSRSLALANKSKKGVEGITVEAYRKSTAQKLEKKYSIPSGNELTVGDSKVGAPSSPNGLYRELFASARLD